MPLWRFIYAYMALSFNYLFSEICYLLLYNKIQCLARSLIRIIVDLKKRERRYKMNRWLVKRNHFGNELENLIDSFFQTPFFNLEANFDYSPRVNVIDSENDLTFVFELPGMDKDAIKVLVNDNVLTVSGDRKYEGEIKDDRIIRKEISHGSFKRSFTLPTSVEVKDVLAEYKNGLLEVKLTKKEESKPKEINVKVS